MNSLFRVLSACLLMLTASACSKVGQAPHTAPGAGSNTNPGQAQQSAPTPIIGQTPVTGTPGAPGDEVPTRQTGASPLSAEGEARLIAEQRASDEAYAVRRAQEIQAQDETFASIQSWFNQHRAEIRTKVLANRQLLERASVVFQDYLDLPRARRRAARQRMHNQLLSLLPGATLQFDTRGALGTLTAPNGGPVLTFTMDDIDHTTASITLRQVQELAPALRWRTADASADRITPLSFSHAIGTSLLDNRPNPVPYYSVGESELSIGTQAGPRGAAWVGVPSNNLDDLTLSTEQVAELQRLLLESVR